jgi:PAS domain S-box-containing protein
MSTVLTPGQGAADPVPVGRLRRAVSASIGRLRGPRGVWLLTVALALASGALFVTVIAQMPAYSEDSLPWPFFVLAFGLAEIGVIHLSVRRQAVTISLAEIPLVIGFYYAAPSTLVLAQLLGAAIALAVVRRQPLIKLVFNLTLFTLTTSLALIVFRAISPPTIDGLLVWWVASYAGTAVVILVSAPAIAAAISLSVGQFQPSALGAGLLVGLVAAAVNTSAALVAVVFLRTNPEDLWLVLAPAIVVGLGYRAYANQRHRQARIEFLYDCARILQRPFFDADTLTEVLVRTREMLGAEVAEIVLSDAGERARPTRAVVGQAGVLELDRDSSGEVLQKRLAMLAPGGQGVLLRRPIRDREAAARAAEAGLTDAVVVPLRGDAGAVGTLTVGNRDPFRGTFTKEDLRVLETLGVHTGIALQNSGLVDRLADSLANVTQLAVAVQSSDDAILALGSEGAITAWNPAAERLFGYPGSELAGMPARVLVPPELTDRITETFGGITAGQGERRGTSEVIRRDGSYLPVSVTVSPIMDGTGALVGLSAIVHDETARREAEAALSESEEQFRTVFRLGPIGMVMVDEHRTWTAVNDALSKLLERTPDQLVGQPSDAFVEPEDVADTRLREAGLFAAGSEDGYAAERRYRTAGGRTVWARVTERPMWSAATGPGGTICMIEDITESRLAAERVRDTEARLHRAVAAFTAVREPTSVLRAVLAAARDLLDAEFAAIGVLSEDGTSIVDLHFDGIDDATASAIGLTPTGRGALGLTSAGTGASRIRDVRKHAAAIGVPPGHPVITSFVAVPIVFEGRLVARLYAGNKMTGQEFDAEDEGVATALAAQAAVVLENARINARTLELIEDLDRANAGLRRANDAKSEFLGTVSHELRTPLHSILVAAELVHDPVFGPLTEERTRELGATIQDSGHHLLGLIDDLVDLSRIEADRIELRLLDLAVYQLLDEVLHQVEPVAADRGVSLEMSCDPDIRILADPLRMRQILVNLVANAVKFTDRGGRVWVEAHDDGWATRVVVHDTGLGIRDDDQDRIFEPFEQVSGLSSPGAGLGLAIARRLVELHGGSLEVSSTLGVGSTFTVSIGKDPTAARDEVDLEAQPAGQVPAGTRQSTILVVEDDTTALNLVSDLLRRSGYLVWQAEDLAGAIERLAAGAPSLVLLDIRLGAEDGLEVARRLRADPGMRNLPILALSADAMQHDADRALEAGCDGHLAKPVLARELLGRIHALLEASTQLDETPEAAAGGRGPVTAPGVGDRSG